MRAISKFFQSWKLARVVWEAQNCRAVPQTPVGANLPPPHLCRQPAVGSRQTLPVLWSHYEGRAYRSASLSSGTWTCLAKTRTLVPEIKQPGGGDAGKAGLNRCSGC